MAYFLVSYLCMSLPIAAWACLSIEKHFWRMVAGAVYLVISAVVLACFAGTADKPGANRISLMDRLSGENEELPTSCDGALDAVTVGFRPVDLNNQEKVMVALGKRIVLQGWMGSPLTQSQVPIVKLVKLHGEKPEVMIPATPMERPDVVAAKRDSLLSRSGFHAEGTLPEDLPLGDYQVIIECRSVGEWYGYNPSCRISVVPPSVVEALDAPYERAAAQAQQALQAQQQAAQNQKTQKAAGGPGNKSPKGQKKAKKKSAESNQDIN